MSFEDDDKENISVEDKVNVIEDNDFLTKNVKDLVQGDYYLFHMTDNFIFLYKDGVVVKSNILDNEFVKYECNTETLQEFIDNSIIDNLGEK